MTLSVSEAESLVRAGVAALQAGKAAEARTLLEQATAGGRGNVQISLLLAYACRQSGDLGAAERATDAVLAKDNRNLRALLVKGDARHGAGDVQGATSFYSTATKLAQHAESLPPDLATELERATRLLQEFSQGFRQRLETHLAAQGFGQAQRTARFQESIAILLEEKQVYFQQPSAYYFPGLPQIQFYDPAGFAWAAAVEAATPAILRELEAAQGGEGLFRPYLQSRLDRPNYDFHGLLDNPAWSTLYLWENGGPIEANTARFPETFAVVQQAPLARITTRAPSILFSQLKAGARIEPHNGMINTRLICHLPLIVPPGCGFRVGNEIREWKVGELLIFDDTIEHEAWNESDSDRVVLIFDVWRPELLDEERAAVTAIFEAIDGAR